MLSMIMVSTLALAINPAFASPGPTVRAPYIVDPLKGPGSIFTVYVTFNSVTRLAKCAINMSFNPSIIQAIGYGLAGATPVFFIVNPSAPKGIDNTAGYVYFGGIRSPARWNDKHTEVVAANGLYDVGESIYHDNNVDGIVSSTPEPADTLVHGPVQPEGTPLRRFQGFEMFADELVFNGLYNDGESIYQDIGDDPPWAEPYDYMVNVTAGDVLVDGPGVYDGWEWGLWNFQTGAVSAGTGDWYPLASITFMVVGRGTSSLDLHNTYLQNVDGGAIVVDKEMDGFFDNRFQGKFFAQIYSDPALSPGDIFPIEIYVDDISKLWGYQFTLTYDTNVLTLLDYMPYEWENLYPFIHKAPYMIDDYYGYARLSANCEFADPTGLSTTEPVAIAKLWFQLDAEGYSGLFLSEEQLVNVYGNVLTVEMFDGSVSSISYQIDLAKRAAWPEHFNFYIQEELDLGEDYINTLYAMVNITTAGGPTSFSVIFNIYNEEGGYQLGAVETGLLTMDPGIYTVTADFDVRMGAPKYKVFVTAQVFYDTNADGIVDSAGLRIKPINFKVFP